MSRRVGRDVCVVIAAAFAFALFAGADPARADADADASPTDASRAEAFFRFDAGSNHTNNWAVLVDTSRYWFNYRHVANTLSFYRTVKRLGIPDSRIILMLADDMACNPRNAFPGAIFGNVKHEVDLYGENVEVDYRGYEVTPENLIRVLTDRHPPGVPRSKRLLTDAGSNVLLFMTGHGGDEFLKFQDQHEIVSRDIADALAQMRAKGRYNEVLFIADTCQASTLAAQVHSPGVLAVGSSEKGENSYSHHHDAAVGLSVIDRFTYHTLEFMEAVEPHSRATARQWFDHLTYMKLRSRARPQTGNYARRLEEARVVDFFGSVTRATPVDDAYDVRGGAQPPPGVVPPRFEPEEEGYRSEVLRAASIEETFRGEGRGGSVGGAARGALAAAAPTAALVATVASVVAKRRREP
jgi:phosphatidylinositol glycan class K